MAQGLAHFHYAKSTWIIATVNFLQFILKKDVSQHQQLKFPLVANQQKMSFNPDPNKQAQELFFLVKYYQKKHLILH